MSSVLTKPNGFEVRGSREAVVAWSAVTDIRAELLSKITYDECFLIFQATSGVDVPVGELDDGFAAFEQHLLSRFPSFPVDWRMRAESAGVGVRIAIWPDRASY